MMKHDLRFVLYGNPSARYREFLALRFVAQPIEF